MSTDQESEAREEYERAIVEATIAFDAKTSLKHVQPKQSGRKDCPDDCLRCNVVGQLPKGSRRLVENARQGR